MFIELLPNKLLLLLGDHIFCQGKIFDSKCQSRASRQATKFEICGGFCVGEIAQMRDMEMAGQRYKITNSIPPRNLDSRDKNLTIKENTTRYKSIHEDKLLYLQT